MTEEQKKAIRVLNRVREKLDDSEYFLLMDFIVKSQEKEFVYVPQFEPYDTPKIQPYYTGTGAVFTKSSE